MSNIKIPFVEKYRPKNIDEIILNPMIREKIVSILNNKYIHNMILTGEPSTGKTSTILFLAKEIYKEKYNDYVLELNASDDRGLSIINDSIYPFCKKKVDPDICKLIILDEADSITNKAQNIFSKNITIYSNTKFVFVCNDYDQIIESIQSKCIIIQYPKLKSNDIFDKLTYVCNNENIRYSDEGINELINISDNDIRQTLNILECLSKSCDIITKENIMKYFDKSTNSYVYDIFKLCNKDNYVNLIKYLKFLSDDGHSNMDILSILINYINKYNSMIDNDIILTEKNKIDMYEILSYGNIILNEVDSFIQLCNVITKMYLYICENNIVV